MLFLGLLFLMCFCSTNIIVIDSKVYYLLPSPNDLCNETSEFDHEECLTLSQFAANSSNYLTNNTLLVFAPGMHKIEWELHIENIHSFFMLADAVHSSSSVIIYRNDAQVNIEFNNISNVKVIGVQFQGCIRNNIMSVGQFVLENSRFYSDTEIYGTILTIVDTIAILKQVTFTCITIAQQLQNLTLHTQFDSPRSIAMILSNGSVITITQSWFMENSGTILYGKHGSIITVFNTTFARNYPFPMAYYTEILYADSESNIKLVSSRFEHNRGSILGFIVVVGASQASVIITHSLFLNNSIAIEGLYCDLNLTHSTFMNNEEVVRAINTNVTISHAEFLGNFRSLWQYEGKTITTISHCKFDNNSAPLCIEGGLMTTITHCIFSNNDQGVISLEHPDELRISHNEFINNNAIFDSLVSIKYYSANSHRSIIYNDFIENIAVFSIYIDSDCYKGLSLSLGSSHCIQCPNRWFQHLIGIIIAAFIAGLALVFIIFAFNLTIAVGSLNGILLYVNLITINADTYFLPFSSPNFVTVFIAWFNLDIGFDFCFFEGMDRSDKSQVQLAFPAYIILLVIIVIIFSECSATFARLVGKGNPIAVLTTMILISYSKFFDAVIGSASLLYLKPAYGSRNLDIIKFDQLRLKNSDTLTIHIEKRHYSFLVFAPIIFLLGVLYTALVFSWQWLLPYQDKPIFKWAKYQKLHHFMEPHHAPYASKHRYWTGLLLFIRVVLFLVGVVNFSKDPQIDLIATIVVVSCLLLLKSITAKRIYKNWLVDVMETAICFNLIILAVLTMYCLKPGARISQSAITYTSVAITFILFLMVVIFHALRYTRLYNYPFVQKLFMKLSSKLSDREVKQETENNNDMPEELDGYQLERAVDPALTHTVMELQEPLLN